jgi:glycerol kinase
MNAILALDLGTTSARAIVFDHSGAVISQAQQEFTQFFPQAGWVEHDANEIWATQRTAAAAAIHAAQEKGAAIKGLGITNQRETTVLWSRVTGEPIARAIVWQDRRTAEYCQLLKDGGHSDVIRDKTGLVIDAYFSGTKLKWLLDHVPNARKMAERGELAFGTMDSWLIYKLTEGKVHATDVSNASRTMLMNIHTLDWDDSLRALMEIPRGEGKLLPKIVSSSGVIGETAALAGIQAGIPIAGIAGDQQAALFGQGCHSAGMAKNTYGTGCFMLMHTGDKTSQSQHQLLTTVAWRLGEDKAEYALEGSVFIAGAAVQWLRDGLGLIQHASEMTALAASVPDTNGVAFVPAFAGLGTPYWDASARGTILGLTRGTTKAHIARATLEAIAFQSADVFNAMRADTGLDLTALRVDGGATANSLLMQFQADILGIPVVAPKITETTALGAAYLAGLAVGVWQSKADIANQWQISQHWQPRMSRDEAQSRMARWQLAVEHARGWA